MYKENITSRESIFNAIVERWDSERCKDFSYPKKQRSSFPGSAPYNQEKEKQYKQSFMENIFVVNENAPIREGNSLLGCLF